MQACCACAARAEMQRARPASTNDLCRWPDSTTATTTLKSKPTEAYLQIPRSIFDSIQGVIFFFYNRKEPLLMLFPFPEDSLPFPISSDHQVSRLSKWRLAWRDG